MNKLKKIWKKWKLCILASVTMLLIIILNFIKEKFFVELIAIVIFFISLCIFYFIFIYYKIQEGLLLKLFFSYLFNCLKDYWKEKEKDSNKTEIDWELIGSFILLFFSMLLSVHLLIKLINKVNIPNAIEIFIIKYSFIVIIVMIYIFLFKFFVLLIYCFFTKEKDKGKLKKQGVLNIISSILVFTFFCIAQFKTNDSLIISKEIKFKDGQYIVIRNQEEVLLKGSIVKEKNKYFFQPELSTFDIIEIYGKMNYLEKNKVEFIVKEKKFKRELDYEAEKIIGEIIDFNSFDNLKINTEETRLSGSYVKVEINELYNKKYNLAVLESEKIEIKVENKFYNTIFIINNLLLIISLIFQIIYIFDILNIIKKSYDKNKIQKILQHNKEINLEEIKTNYKPISNILKMILTFSFVGFNLKNIREIFFENTLFVESMKKFSDELSVIVYLLGSFTLIVLIVSIIFFKVLLYFFEVSCEVQEEMNKDKNIKNEKNIIVEDNTPKQDLEKLIKTGINDVKEDLK